MKFRELVRMTVAERSNYITVAATALGISELVVEKDLWVVWTLEQVFALSAEFGPFTFKGGTSLSKGFNAIQRFSEDIDISIRRATLGFPDDAYFYEALSGKEARCRVDQIRDTVRAYAIDRLMPALCDRIAGELRDGWDLDVDNAGGLRFSYPTGQHGMLGYIRPDVVIEFGHADAWPARDIAIKPYVTEAISTVTGSVNVHVLDPHRTFWEKATILHEIAHRDETLPFPDRYSRHYYDLTRLGRSDIGESAIKNTDLLAAVARFKSVFFASNRARYDLAMPGTLRLLPPSFRLDAVVVDYEQMLPMLFGDILTIDDIFEQLTSLERQINQSAS